MKQENEAAELAFLAAIRQATPEALQQIRRMMQSSIDLAAVPVPVRVKRELKRLRMTQTTLIAKLGPALGGVFKRGMRDQSVMTFDLLAAMAHIGFDVSYVVTGHYQAGGINDAALHHSVLDAVDLLSLEDKIDGKQLAGAVAKLAVKHHRTGSFLPITGLYDRVKTGIVRVLKFDGENRCVGYSTGSVVGNGCFVLTCEHSVSECASVGVLPYGQETPITGNVAYSDPENDLALIALPEAVGEALPLEWKSATMTGDGAVIIGFPLSVPEATLVSAHIAGMLGVQLRLDATINRGNSGSPVLNLKGEIVGVVRVKFHSLPELLDEVDSITPGGSFEELQVAISKLQELAGNIRSNLVHGLAEAASIDALINGIGPRKLKTLLQGDGK